MNRIRLVCGRHGDPWTRHRADSLTRRCERCGYPVWVHPETLAAGGPNPEVVCIECNFADRGPKLILIPRPEDPQ